MIGQLEGNTDLKPFQQRATELSIEEEVLMWSCRVLIRQKFRTNLLQKLHGTHFGINKLKAVAR